MKQPSPRPPIPPRRSWVTARALIYGSILILAWCFIGVPGLRRAKKTTARPTESSAQRFTPAGHSKALADLKYLEESGFLKRFDARMNEAYVDPRVWHGLTIQVKENITTTLAAACEARGDKAWIEIKDNFSGKTLAKYGFMGFKNYP